jgi:hypothetical protein
MEEQVVEMHPFKGEASTAFGLRVETERRRTTIDRASTYHAPVKRNLDLYAK